MAKPKRRPQISLRMLLLVVTLVCIAFAYHHRFRRQHLAANQLVTSNNAKISYHASAIAWLPWIGDKLCDVEAVDLSHCRIDSDSLKLLLRFPNLNRLYLARTRVEDDDLSIIAKLRNLQRLALWHTNITGRGIGKLVALKRLRALDVHGTQLTESCLASLAELGQLRELKYDFNRYSDRGLALLASMPNRPLGELRCQGITNAGLQSLKLIAPSNYRITRLQECDISDDSLLALTDGREPLPVGPEFHVRKCLLSDRTLVALPWDTLTDVRFIDTDVTFDAVVRIVGDRFKFLVIGERGYILAENYQWSLGRGYAPDGLSVWMGHDPTELSRKQIGTLTSLTSVFLNRKQPAKDLLADLSQHQGLTAFEMSSAPAQTAVIEQIANWQNLRHARLNCCNPRTIFDIRPLVKLKRLQRLEFYCTPFGDQALETVGQIRGLRELKLSSANKILGPGLKQLRNLQHLELLEIQSSANWDAWFDDLMSLDHIERIRLIDVKLNDANLRAFESKPGRDHVSWN